MVNVDQNNTNTYTTAVVSPLKSFWSFASANVFTLALIIFILFLAGYIYCKIIKFRKTREFNFDLLGDLFFPAVLSFIVSILIFSVSTIWVEYPLGHNIWKKSNSGEWIKHESRVLHKPFMFEGYKIDKGGFYYSVKISDKAPLIVKYKITDDTLPVFLKTLERKITSGCNCGRVDIRSAKIIQEKSFKLLLLHPVETLMDDKIRKKVFQDYYTNYGIIIESVDFP